MPTNERIIETAAWLNNLNVIHGWDGVIHEVTAALDEMGNFSHANRRYRETLANVFDALNSLYDETGYERLLDMANDVRRLIQWSDSGTMPIQLDFFEAVPDEASRS